MLKIDIQYFGTIHYVKTLMKHKQITFDHNASFTKMSFKNRMVIMTAQGPLMLTIPIVGGRNQKTPIKDIYIDYSTNWTSQHYKSIKTNYKRSPYFEFYEQSLESLYSIKPEKLVDFLLHCTQWLQNQLKVTWEISNLNELLEGNTECKCMDPWVPNNYHQAKGLPIYQQVFSNKNDFVPNISILDMLLNMGGREVNKLLAQPIS
jgi:hypothetical protein